MRAIRLFTMVLLFAARPSPGVAQATSLTARQIDRLVSLGEVWGVAKYFHPAFLKREIAWDSALVATVPRILAASDAAAFGAEINRLLLGLDDRYTKVIPRDSPMASDADGGSVSARWASDSLLIVSIPRFLNDIYDRLRTIAPLVRAARRVVFDLRGPRPSVVGEADDVFANTFDAALPSSRIASPRVLQRMLRAYSAPREVYESGGDAFRPASPGVERRTAFVLYADSDLPRIAWALQQAGQGVVVLDTARGSVINPWSSRTTTHRTDIGEGWAAEFRLSEAIGRPGGVLAADTLTARVGDDDVPLRIAKQSIMTSRTPKDEVPSAAFTAAQAESAYADMRYPALPYRMLAAFRYWNAIRYFFPSELPTGETWYKLFRESIVSLAGVSDSTEYAVALFEMARKLKDGHSGAASQTIFRLRGEFAPGFLVELVEHQAVVVSVSGDSALRASGIRVGDVVLKVDGENIATRRERFSRFAAGTRPDVIDDRFAFNSITTGAAGTTARLTIRTSNGTVREISLPRRSRPCPVTQCTSRTGPVYRMLPGNIGYADLARLNESQVDSMFDAFKSTTAIIFDDRGYPRGTTFAITARLAPKAGTVLARGTRPVWMSPDPMTAGTMRTVWRTEPTAKPLYRGKLVVLIDSHAQSQAEQAALSIGAMGATLIGSPTVGALGSTTPVILPGGITGGFPTGEWHWADGRPIQRVGIQPNIFVRPTVAGIRRGRDEVLERALEFLRSGRQ